MTLTDIHFMVVDDPFIHSLDINAESKPIKRMGRRLSHSLTLTALAKVERRMFTWWYMGMTKIEYE